MLRSSDYMRIFSADKDTFKKNLKQLMDEKRVKSVDVCEALHIYKGTFSGWYTGRAYPSPEALESLCKYFGCDVERFFKSSNDAPTTPVVTETAGTDYISDLMKVSTLYKEGLLSKEEFETIKADIMSRVGK